MEARLSRIILFSKDVTLLKLFYQRFFKFRLVEEIPGEWVVLNAGTIEIAFHKPGDAYLTDDDKPFKVDSNTKLVFEINSEIAAFRQMLLEQGVLVRDIKAFEGFNFLFCDGEDPEGNVFQISQRINT